MTVDYKDVLDQAVNNERWVVLRELYSALEAVAITERASGGYSYQTSERSARDFKTDLLAALDRIERAER